MSRSSYCRSVAFERFRTELGEISNAKGLFRAALAISLHERPETDFNATEQVVDQIVASIQARVRSTSQTALLAHLHDVLFDEYQLRGNRSDYYNPANSYLAEVLRSRRGLPITLALIYKRVAEPLGLVVHGVNSPGHFLAEVEPAPHSGEKAMYVDPFFGGGVLTIDEAFARIGQATGQPVLPTSSLLSRASPEQWLSRMLTNLQAAFSAAGQERNVYAMQELQALIEP